MRKVACLDAKSFFATCECIERNLDPLTTPLVVADSSRGKGSIVLAITPYLKKIGVDSRCRIRDLPKDKNIIIAEPRMKMYLQKSMDVVNTYLDYVSEEDIFVYSVDEVFIDLTPYLPFYKTNSYKLTRALQNKVREKTGIILSAGIGDNMLLAKLAMDIEAKHNADNIAYWSKDDVENKLWNVEKITDIWGIGAGMEKRLSDIGIKTIKQLAHTDVNILKKYFGKMGVKLYDLANGIDNTIISKDISYTLPKSIGNSQMLHTDVDSKNAKLLIREMLEGIIMKLKLRKYVARGVHVYVRYSYADLNSKFSKSITLEHHTDDLHTFLKVINDCLDNNLEEGQIRQVAISLGHIEYKKYIQLNLFDDYEKNEKIDETIVDLKEKFGKGSVQYATSLLDESTINYRNKLVGGHKGGSDE